MVKQRIIFMAISVLLVVTAVSDTLPELSWRQFLVVCLSGYVIYHAGWLIGKEEAR